MNLIAIEVNTTRFNIKLAITKRGFATNDENKQFLLQSVTCLLIFIAVFHDAAGHPRMMKMWSSRAIVKRAGTKVETSLVP